MSDLGLSNEDYKTKLVFKAEWFEPESKRMKHFALNFYPCDSSLELYDVDRGKMFLRRSFCEGVGLKDMYVGNTVRVYSRQIELKDYGDAYTKDTISKEKEHTLALIKPTAIENLGEILTQVHKNGFSIVRLRLCNLTRHHALEFYKHKKGDSFLPVLVEHLASGPVLALELVGRDAVQSWRKLIGPTDPDVARRDAPQSLRALYGRDIAANGFHGADDHQEAVRQACFFFPQGVTDRKPPQSTALYRNSTLCIVKPHAVLEGKLGDVLAAIINSKFKFTAMQMFYLSNANAEEFLEVYKGVVSDFHALVLSLLDGPLVAMEICGKTDDFDVHEEFRRFAGPPDPDTARQIRPECLRARFGVGKYTNAIHCTDLAEDTVLELEYFFKILVDL